MNLLTALIIAERCRGLLLDGLLATADLPTLVLGARVAANL
jgi:hypothetical protein